MWAEVGQLEGTVVLVSGGASGVGRAPVLRLAEANPTRRLSRPDDVAGVVAFLCRDAGARVNRQVVHVDGGHQFAGML